MRDGEFLQNFCRDYGQAMILLGNRSQERLTNLVAGGIRGVVECMSPGWEQLVP